MCFRTSQVIVCLLTFKVMSTSLKTLGKVFDAAKPTYITNLFTSDMQTDNEATDEKRTKLGHNLQNANTKTSNREKLAFMLYRRLRDSSWEIRDSTLEFVVVLLQLNQGKSCMQWSEARHCGNGNRKVEKQAQRLMENTVNAIAFIFQIGRKFQTCVLNGEYVCEKWETTGDEQFVRVDLRVVNISYAHLPLTVKKLSVEQCWEQKSLHLF